MRDMFIITAIMSLFISCNKTVEPTFTLNGNWGLVQTELYENNKLNGSSYSNEITTFYLFENCHSKGEDCQLTISEDGENEIYGYNYEANEKLFTVADNRIYHIELLTENELVFHKEYGIYKSKYTFRKVE